MGFPRVRGDVPKLVHNAYWIMSVFPACAGMFRFGGDPAPSGGCFPRVRGDVPMLPALGLGKKTFSPRARGCS